MPDIETARSWYSNDPTHGFDHILRVYRFAEKLAALEGADLEIVRAAALLHDAHAPGPASAAYQAQRTGHHRASASFARQVLESEGWPEERIAAVEHCIRSHRFRDPSEPPQTLEAKVLFDADKLDAIGAVGVMRAAAYAITHGCPPFAEPSEYFLQTGQTQEGEAHTAVHEYFFKLRRIPQRLYTPSGRRIASGRSRLMARFFNQLLAEDRAER